jgi:uncharacterized protein (UPF0128 family)
MVEKLVVWTNQHAESHFPTATDTPHGKLRSWRPTIKRELPTYFEAIISGSCAAANNRELLEASAADYLNKFIAKDRFQRLDQHVRAISVLDNGYKATFDRVDELSKHLRVPCRRYWNRGRHLAIDETIERFCQFAHCS